MAALETPMIQARVPRTAMLLSLTAMAAILGGKAWSAEGGGPDAEAKPKTIAELVADSDRKDGLFTLFRDRKTGQVRMLVKPDQLDEEFIYFAQASNGLPQVGFIVRGTYLVDDVITVRRHFDRLEFVAENTAFYFNPDSPLSRARDANLTSSLLAVEKIVAEDPKTGEMLIEADKLFLTQSLYQVKPSPDPNADPKTTWSLGTLSETKSRILGLRSYPLNTDVEVEYVFEDPAPRHDLLEGAYEIKDARNVPIRVMHSFIAMPTEPYAPRRDDPRIGYYGQRVTDLTLDSPTPYRDVINRWKLVKKDPTAAVSEPVEPIVWWIENTTPHEWRDIIRDATLAWNSSFEKAGFRNAIVVKVQPDDADWDAGDIRYNVLRWTSSPSLLFGGYGPSMANPRTGQILGADVMLEFAYVTWHLARTRVMAATEPGRQALCSAGHVIGTGTMLGRALAGAVNLGSELEEKMLREALYNLILHEVGHTFALTHNMKATTMASPEQLFDPAYVAEHGTSGSVMEPGPYDDWAIEYGYSPALEDPVAEEARLQAILARAGEPQLAYGNDQDDMRTPGAGIDPRVNIFDQSNDPVRYAVDQIALIRTAMGGLTQRFVRPGQSNQELVTAFDILMSGWRNNASVISRQVGGVYVERDWIGSRASYTPVSLEVQRGAMKALATDVFAPDAFAIPPDLYAALQPQPREFDFYGKTEDPKIHEKVLSAQRAALDHLLHPVVLKRITDSRLYGNEYALAAMMTELTDAIFQADLPGDVNTFRQALQVEYVGRLSTMVAGDSKAAFDALSQSMAVHELQRLRKALGRKRDANLETRAHTGHLLLLVDRALDATA